MSFRLITFLSVGLVLQSQEPDGLKAVAQQFQAAVANNDIDAMSEIVRFPLKSNEFPTIKSKADLKRLYPKIFPADRKKGLIGQPTIKLLNGVYSVSSKDQNDPIQFLFKRFGDRYKLYSIDNVNE